MEYSCKLNARLSIEALKLRFSLQAYEVNLTIFLKMFPFDPPENIRKALVFWCFQGDQKGTLARKGLIMLDTLNTSATFSCTICDVTNMYVQTK